MALIELIEEYTKTSGKKLESGRTIEVTNDLAAELIELKIAKNALPVKKIKRKQQKPK